MTNGDNFWCVNCFRDGAPVHRGFLAGPLVVGLVQFRTKSHGGFGVSKSRTDVDLFQEPQRVQKASHMQSEGGLWLAGSKDVTHALHVESTSSC